MVFRISSRNTVIVAPFGSGSIGREMHHLRVGDTLGYLGDIRSKKERVGCAFCRCFRLFRRGLTEVLHSIIAHRDENCKGE